jgi:dUTP pyrophosphatase
MSLRHKRNKTMKVKFKKLDADALVPIYKTPGAAGMDLHVLLREDVILDVGEIRLLGTGLAIALPKGYEAQIRSRSGLALHNGLVILNSPGTIDTDYRGEIKLILKNCGNAVFRITNGMRLAQMVICKYERITPDVVTELDSTQRHNNGFGSTGTR